MKHVLFVITALMAHGYLCAQYTVNGSAIRDNCHCYTLTPNTLTQSGSVWNNIKINLTQSFDFNFDINLGCSDAGADGIVFVLQPISTSVGTTGGGIGYEGVSPAVGVTIDTWQNTPNNDPFYDHIAIQLNGNIDHANAGANIAGPVSAIAGNDNIEDCGVHTLRIKWDAAAKELSAYVDGVLRVSAVKDIVAEVFSGNPLVFWGFTGSTGGASNLQRVCTALSPKFTFSQGQKRCINEPVTFFDSTISFTSLQKRYWDFGDGSAVDSVNLNPVHTYTAAGDYTVTQRVIGADGCEEINTQLVRIGSIPVADFKYGDSCVQNNILFTDMSTATIGTVSEWYWDLDNGSTSTQQEFNTQYPTGGTKNVKLLVKTLEGCVSDTVIKQVYIYSRPVLDFSFADSVCLGTAINFTGTVTSSSDPVQAFVWNFGDNTPVNTINAQYVFQTAGPHNVLFAATSTGNAGCLGVVTKTVFIKRKPVAYFKNDAVCQGSPVLLIDSSYNADGTAVSARWWDLGNGQFSVVQNPTVQYNTSDTIPVKLVVRSGTCVSDTLVKGIVVAPKPVVDIGFTGNGCEGQSLQFTDSSKIKSGAITQWLWLQNGTPISTEKNPVVSFPAGSPILGHAVISDKGCKSDTVFKTFSINSQPKISMLLNDGCKDQPVGFTANANPGTLINSWRWSFGDGSVADTIQPVHQYNAAGTYPVQLFAIDRNGCKSDTLKGSTIVYSTNAAINRHSINASANQPVQLNASGGISYEWTPAEGLSNPFIANPVAVNAEDRKYTVRAYTPFGCDTYDTVLIRVFDGPEIYVPTAFAPNSTAGNGMLTARAVGISRFDYFTVYNRYGEAVFSTADPFKGWDGNYKGRPQVAGVYVWIASGITFRGTTMLRRGTVVLIR